MPTVLPLSKLVDLALGTPEVGAVNFNVLHTLLHAMISKLNLTDAKAEINDSDRDFLSSSKLQSLRFVTAPSDLDSGKGEDSEDGFSEIRDASETDTPVSSATHKSKRPVPYHHLELRVEKLAEQLESLNALPSNANLFERSKQAKGDGERPVAEMWQYMQLKKRVDGNEDGVGKLMSIVEDLMKELQTLKDSNADLMNKINGLNIDELNKKLADLEKITNDLNDKFSTLPTPDDYAQFVTWPLLEDALKGVRKDMEGLTQPERVVVEIGSQTDQRAPSRPTSRPTSSRPPSSRPQSRLSTSSSGPTTDVLDVLERLGKLSDDHEALAKRVKDLEDQMKNKVDKEALENLNLSGDLLDQINRLKEDLDALQAMRDKPSSSSPSGAYSLQMLLPRSSGLKPCSSQFPNEGEYESTCSTDAGHTPTDTGTRGTDSTGTENTGLTGKGTGKIKDSSGKGVGNTGLTETGKGETDSPSDDFRETGTGKGSTDLRGTDNKDAASDDFGRTEKGSKGLTGKGRTDSVSDDPIRTGKGSTGLRGKDNKVAAGDDMVETGTGKSSADSAGDVVGTGKGSTDFASDVVETGTGKGSTGSAVDDIVETGTGKGSTDTAGDVVETGKGSLDPTGKNSKDSAREVLIETGKGSTHHGSDGFIEKGKGITDAQGKGSTDPSNDGFIEKGTEKGSHGLKGKDSGDLTGKCSSDDASDDFMDTEKGKSSTGHSGTKTGVDSRSLTEAGTAKGSTSHTGTAKGSTSHTGTAKGSTSHTETAKGSTSHTETAKGSTSHTGTAKSSTSHTGTAKRSTSHTGTAKGSTSHTGTAKGSTSHTGTAKSSTSHTGTAKGSTSHTGTAKSSTSHTGTAKGSISHEGTGKSSTSHAGTAKGLTGTASRKFSTSMTGKGSTSSIGTVKGGTGLTGTISRKSSTGLTGTGRGITGSETRVKGLKKTKSGTNDHDGTETGARATATISEREGVIPECSKSSKEMLSILKSGVSDSKAFAELVARLGVLEDKFKGLQNAILDPLATEDSGFASELVSGNRSFVSAGASSTASGNIQVTDNSDGGELKTREGKSQSSEEKGDIQRAQSASQFMDLCELSDMAEDSGKDAVTAVSEGLSHTNDKLKRLGGALDQQLGELRNKLFTLDTDLKRMAKGLEFALLRTRVSEMSMTTVQQKKEENIIIVQSEKLESDREEIDNDALSRAQQAILQLQAELERLQNTTENIITDNNHRSKQIERLLNYCDTLQEKKADKEYVAMEVDVKADKRQLDKKVNHSLFDSTTGEINKIIKEILDKLEGDSGWKDAFKQLAEDMDGKLDRLEIDPLKEWLESRLKALNKKIMANAHNEWGEDDAAGLRKQLLQRFNCLSCDRPVDLMPTGPVPSLPSQNGLPATRSPRPYTTFELEQIRQHAKSFNNQEVSDYYATMRQCGGSHTLTYPHKRVSRMTQMNNLFKEETEEIREPVTAAYPIYKEEVDVQGVDGHIYRGRMERVQIEAKMPSKMSGGQFTQAPKTPGRAGPKTPQPDSLPIRATPTPPLNSRGRPMSARVLTSSRPGSGRSMSQTQFRPLSARHSGLESSRTTPLPEDSCTPQDVAEEGQTTVEAEAIRVDVPTPDINEDQTEE